MKFIKISIIDDVATITFNNDSKSNALSFEMLKEIEQSLDKFSDKNVRVVIIRSNPDAKVWSAGLDINELPEPGKDPLPYSHPLEELMRKIEDHNAPIIAMVTGSVWGGGFDFAVTCDMIIGSPSCSFAITPAKIG
ncbi:MAG TPA: enoyl-CoA hydratase-related protein, partial [Bacteroidales bacterium]|nr:enoyl-CoA hydratase-related protein [Bacteroidales bacterium]